MANQHGDFIWYELLTSDAQAAQHFYGKVLGWQCTDSGQSAVDYRIVQASGGAVAGLMQITDEMRAGGGKVIVEPQQIPGGGYALNAIDPQRAPFGLVGTRR